MGLCGTYGCTRADKHRGLHDVATPSSRRRRQPPYRDANWQKRAAIPQFRSGPCADDRDEVLVLDPVADYLATGTPWIPSSPHPTMETSRTASPSSFELKSKGSSANTLMLDLIEYGTTLGTAIWDLLDKRASRAGDGCC